MFKKKKELFERPHQDWLNRAHSNEPKAGDYWQEILFHPVFRVLMVDDNWVLVQELAGYAGKEIDENNPKPKVLSRGGFKRRLRYHSIPHKTWCDVVPEKFTTKVGEQHAS